ncbi:RagB/SusD family nutrient uptake outer membrane protein [Niabella ginsengisoli]|uniref:RagB/SusD family nutrient uptake outer membrane protein n=1 Tax=Niabella ginsengisoli TaxID=522298 RepID=A0ABS9SJ69_9BACT|nr:RagB/SusD family nutrient uptake outer membrane protein [Niabella ginsengisoli]
METEKFYKTAADAESALVGCYNMLNSSAYGRMFGETVLYLLNGSNDECITRSGVANSISPFGSGSYTASETELKNIWEALYAGVNRCNHLIEKIDAIEMNAGRKSEIKGEALFLRGFYEMYLALMFGAVPVNTEPDPDFFTPRLSLQEVYDQILSDFSTSANMLPNRAAIAGRANKWSAEGMRAKVYAYLASCKTNNVGSDLELELNHFSWANASVMYDSVDQITTRIISQSGFKLTDQYNYLFRETTRPWQYEECLFTVEGSSTATNSVGNRLNQAWLPQGNVNTRGGSGSKWFVPTAEVYKRYHASDVRRNHNLTGSIPGGDNAPVEIIENVRYYVPATANITTNAYGIGKYRYRDPVLKEISPFMSDGAIPLLRYADILLLNAEAMYYKGDEAGARAMFVPIRQRALYGTTTDLATLTTAYQKADFVEELLDERSRELCFEVGIRRFDMIRFGKLNSTITSLPITGGFHNINSLPILKTNWQPYKIWFPIPTAELDLNKNLVQNDGY